MTSVAGNDVSKRVSGKQYGPQYGSGALVAVTLNRTLAPGAGRGKVAVRGSGGVQYAPLQTPVCVGAPPFKADTAMYPAGR